MGSPIVRSGGGGRRIFRFIVTLGIVALIVYLRVHGTGG
jgi:hypothetical protein